MEKPKKTRGQRLKTKIIIQGELTDLNKFINSQRANRFGGAALKKKNTQKCAVAFKPIAGKKLKLPINLKIDWYCKDKRKDKDNIRFGIKFIQDGMIEAGVLKNDGWGEISGYQDRFYVDKENPRIEIEIIEAEEK